MNGREIAMACAFGCCLVAFLSFLGTRHKRELDVRTRRFELLAEALRAPDIDPGTRAELLRALARDHHGIFGWIWQRLQQPMLWRVLWFGTGWLLMVMCGAALVTYGFGWGMLRSYDLPPVVMMFAFGFGMLTLPLALRELFRRERNPASH